VLEDGPRVFRPLEDPPGEQMLATGVPFGFGVSRIAPLAPAPRLGEHTHTALQEWLGMTPDEIAAVEAEGTLV
jgi:crotonobetainyl-CoA:carnitine CoA-transferase CaiB-like acyl-CoA transferase